MTNLTAAKMFDPNEGQNSGIRRPLWIILAALGIVMTTGFIAGFTAQHQNDGGGAFTGIAAAIFAAAILAIIGLGYWTWQNAKAMKVPGENLTRRELLNRNILSGCIFLGGIMGIGLPIMFEGGGSTEAITIFSNSPLPTNFALAFAFVLLVIVPAITWYWHRYAIDEMEESAYRDGSYYAAHAFLFLTPVWWLLWRGGLLPEPNGVAIYFVFSMVWTIVWFWKKHL
ncbi:hypothetical protein [Sphingorhabdus sp.]|jgi:membrane protease YdiL (CAAX protease family)|uniref:hypothetical protein n=1 Tax=Sphingorhabdus sp. TaxID=1902408 RepID=UPI00333ECD85